MLLMMADHRPGSEEEAPSRARTPSNRCWSTPSPVGRPSSGPLPGQDGEGHSGTRRSSGHARNGDPFRLPPGVGGMFTWLPTTVA